MSEDQLPIEETRDALIQRHKKEQKDLIATITGLKKQATKKTRKNVLQKCQELQDNLNQKQQDELKKFDGSGDVIDDDEGEEEMTPEKLLEQMSLDNKPQEELTTTSTTSNEPKKKRNRQKERLERRKQEIEKIKQEAIKESANSIDYRKLEQESMEKILSMNNLQLYEIKPDGHCLFASIQDQLSIHHNKSIEIQELKSTAMWGSDMEILALANIFNCPIIVYMAGSSELKINPDGELKELNLGYFKHSYGLGEHYNSLRDL